VFIYFRGRTTGKMLHRGIFTLSTAASIIKLYEKLLPPFSTGPLSAFIVGTFFWGCVKPKFIFMKKHSSHKLQSIKNAFRSRAELKDGQGCFSDKHSRRK
jgi:hypothetical protein